MNLKQYTSEFKRNLQIAWPIMLGQIGHVTVGLVDNIMVGDLGAASLAAISLANGFFFIAMGIGIGFTLAITPLIAEADGKNHNHNLTSYFHHGLFLCIILGMALTIFLFAANPLMQYMNQPKEVIELAMPYLYAITYTIIPIMIFQAYRQFSDGLSLTQYPMRATIIANIVNIIFNYLLIYGIWIFPRLEIMGAAIGTFIARIVMIIILIWMLKSNKKVGMYLEKFRFSVLKRKVIHKIFHLGYPISLQMLFELSLFSMAVFLAGMLGVLEQAANQIVINLSSITFMVAWGLGATATIRVSNQKGLKDLTSLKRIAFSVVLLMLLIDIVLAVGFIGLSSFLPQFYIDEIEVIAIAVNLIIVVGIFQIPDGLQVVYIGCLRGLQDVKIPTLITFVAYWVVGVPLCYLLAFTFNMKALGIWIGILIALVASTIMLYFRYKFLTKKF